MTTIRAACALLLLFCLTAHAAEGVNDRLRTQTRFDIPAQALGTSLKQLAEQAGVQILFEEDMVRGLSAPALKAQQSVEQALHVLLGNTGLVYVASGDAIAVRKAFGCRASRQRRPERAVDDCSRSTTSVHAEAASVWRKRPTQVRRAAPMNAAPRAPPKSWRWS